MSPRRYPPRLVLGPLTGRIYVATRYRTLADGTIEASEKWDVTNEFLSLYETATAKFTYNGSDGSRHG